MVKGKFIIILILFAIIGKASSPISKYFENNNKLQTSISKLNTNNDIVDFIFEESTIEEQEEEEDNENTNENLSKYPSSNASNFLCFSTNTLFVRKKLSYNCFSKKHFTTNKLYISFSTFRI